ncbi:hypothetical protein Q7P37_005483 [Cladosporium fusiforme]
MKPNMTNPKDTSEGIFALPNEILLNVFSLLPTPELLPVTPTCRHFHSLILRLIHHRLQIADGLDGHVLYLECHHPSERLTAPPLFCSSLGTDGLDSFLSDVNDKSRYVGQIKKLGSMYSRFRPERNEPEFKVTRRHPAGDVPGSRTWQDTTVRPAVLDVDNIVRDTITVDAHELFSQLITVAYLGRREGTRGLLCSLQEVGEGTIRVWRDWLSRNCESRTFSDQSTVVIHHGGSSSEGPEKGKGRADSVIDTCDPTNDPQVLWINTRGEDVGVKLKVKRKKQQAANTPLLYSSDIELSVSYAIEFEEVYVRTSHLLLKLEEAEKQISNDTAYLAYARPTPDSRLSPSLRRKRESERLTSPSKEARPSQQHCTTGITDTMHCSSRSIFGGLLSATAQRSATLPPGFLVPAFSSASQTSNFSTSATRAARKDGNPARGISAIRRTGMNKKIKLSVDVKNLPKPVLDPARRSKVETSENHGLWEFFNADRVALQTPVQIHAHGRGWTLQELRAKSWDDLHRLWWVCLKDINRVMTNEAERIRLDAGYGQYEAEMRLDEIRQTQKNIKICLTQRWYSWEEARVAAMEDEEIDLYADADKGQSAYLPKEHSQDAFEESSNEASSLDAPDAAIREKIAAEQARKEVRA